MKAVHDEHKLVDLVLDLEDEEKRMPVFAVKWLEACTASMVEG